MTWLRRHTLVWLSQAPEAETDEDRARAAAWQMSGRPFIVTRRRDDGRDIGLGFCTTDPAHPELRPRRVAARTDPGRIVRDARPPGLAEIARCPAATAKANSFSRLISAAASAGVDIRVYGSWMWQALTGERHVHEASDLDVVIDVADLDAAGRAAAFLAAAEQDLTFRIDGELSFPGVGEVQWRELLQDKVEVLLKSVDTLKLVPRSQIGR
ncbi:malonate decarboxylase holo-[acyl-carrier-protein] synthase [Reyranella sp.]|uniref:malonate decarboxylase holo-[acyl-carrier-protein] synthase n=1 Tax=Reyranella sp. TaxID=1929291 RepID=UPI003D105461